MSEKTPNPMDMLGGLDMASMYQNLMSGFMKDYMQEVKEIAKVESLLATLPSTRDVYAMYNATQRLIDIVSRYEHFSEEEVETVKRIGKKLIKILKEKIKQADVDIDQEALRKVLDEGVFE